MVAEFAGARELCELSGATPYTFSVFRRECILRGPARAGILLGKDAHFSRSGQILMLRFEQFSQDTQFLRLVHREPDVDLVAAGLEIARDVHPNLDFSPTHAALQQAVARLTHPITRAGSDFDELKLLVCYMTEEMGLYGRPDCLDDVDAHYLHKVLETGRGIPISLSLLYLHVANELGIPLEPIATPGRFLTRLQTEAGMLYVDAFDQGRILDEVECVELICSTTQFSPQEVYRFLRPADERSIAIRMLQNLKNLFGRQERWTDAWRVQSRLSMLMPGSWRERRDHAVLTLRAGRYGEAVELLKKSLSVCPDEDRHFLQGHLSQALRLLPESN